MPELHGPTLYPRKRGASRPEEARARVRPEPDSISCSSGVGVRAVDAIELHEAEGALERIESWLRERGFFAPGGEELVADLYLGYGLSSTIRRRHSPAPARAVSAPARGLCRPTGTARVERDNSVRLKRLRFGPWQPTWGAASYGEVVERVREAIARGDVYQVNLVQHLSATFAGDPGTLAARLATPEAAPPRALSRQTAGRSCPHRRSCSSRDAAAASGRARSRGRALRVAQPSCAARRRTRPST